MVPAAADVRITSPAGPLATTADGVVTLEWETTDPEAKPLRYEVEQSSAPNFGDVRPRYRGPDQASVLSGLPEGTFHFRVRAIGPDGAAGEWSEPLALEVAYMPRGQVIVLLTGGVIVFFATIGTLLAGHFRQTPAA